jgi:hypothetical protein
MSQIGQDAKSFLKLAFPLPPGADMPLRSGQQYASLRTSQRTCPGVAANCSWAMNRPGFDPLYLMLTLVYLPA